MKNPVETMDTHLAGAHSAFKRGQEPKGLMELVVALQAMSDRMEAMEKKLEITYDKKPRIRRRARAGFNWPD
ncbi:MAG: hypothetical protein ABIQ35_10475 [Verrucomicrobiota bacterium]